MNAGLGTEGHRKISIILTVYSFTGTVADSLWAQYSTVQYSNIVNF